MAAEVAVTRERFPGVLWITQVHRNRVAEKGREGETRQIQTHLRTGSDAREEDTSSPAKVPDLHAVPTGKECAARDLFAG